MHHADRGTAAILQPLLRDSPLYVFMRIMTMLLRRAAYFAAALALGFFVPFTLAAALLTTALTLVATLSFFGGGAFFLVTPVGFAPLILAVSELVVLVVSDLLVLGLVVRLMAGAVSTAWKMRGLELPVAERVPSRAMIVIVWGFGVIWFWRQAGGEIRTVGSFDTLYSFSTLAIMPWKLG